MQRKDMSGSAVKSESGWCVQLCHGGVFCLYFIETGKQVTVALNSVAVKSN